MATTRKRFETVVEGFVGKRVDEIRQATVDQMRREVEEKTGRVTEFISAFPKVGRGFTGRDKLVSHDEAEVIFHRAVEDDKKA